MFHVNIAFMSQTNSSNVIKMLTQIPDLVLIIKIGGGFDMSVTVMIKSIEQLLEVQDKLWRIPGITKLETHVSKEPSVFLTPRQYISTF